MESTIKVYIVTGFEPLQTGLAEIIQKDAAFDLVGEASSLEQTLHDDRFAEADVLILDVKAFGDSADDMSTLANDRLSGRKALLLGDVEFVNTLSLDAILPLLACPDSVGYLPKEGPSWRLMETLRLVAGGTFVCETTLMKSVLSRLQETSSARPAEQLSERQAEILALVAAGHSNKEMASQLSLSESTIKAHVSQVMSKLGLTRRTELVRWALTSGLLAEDETANKP